MKVSPKYAKTYGKPDVIIASSPHPLTMIAGIRMARKFKIPCICEVRDLWPEAIFAFGKLTEHSLLGKLLTAGEHWIYRNADALIFTKEGDTDYIKTHKWDTDNGGDIDLTKCHYINNGVNVEAFLQDIADNPIKDTDLLDNKFHVVYIGSIRPVNDVSMLLDAAALLKGHSDIQFLIYGDGNQKEALQQRVLGEGLTNVKMKGHVNRRFIPYILSKSSVNILNYSQSKYNWTRGNSSNKLFEYMASGKPIISTIKMGYCILEKYQCGFSLETSTPEELAKTILKVHDMPQEQYEEMGRNAQTGAEKLFIFKQWFIAFRKKQPFFVPFAMNGFQIIRPPAGRFFADPFIIENEGKNYIFFEDYRLRTRKGVISCIEIDEQGNCSEPQTILEKEYHLAYPFLLKTEQGIFMIPDTSANNTIELYEAVKFPYQWALKRVMMNGFKASDSTIYLHNEKLWLFTNIMNPHEPAGKGELCVFYADSLFGEWQPHRRNPVNQDPRTARPAGNIFFHDGKI
ncbi:MAG: glycosyl transferase group 1 family protein, partial [Firmicutes bacterium]|nr:glycosyl transferase group 1 family protein [Bacillota bacterium]